MDEMTPEEAERFVAHNKLGCLGLAEGSRAYVVPLFYAHRDGAFYFHLEQGAKTGFIEATDEACFAVVRVRSEGLWASVEAFGPVAQVTDEGERRAALEALRAVHLPDEWAVREGEEPDPSTLYALRPSRVTGRKSVPAGVSREEVQLAMGGM